MRSGGKSERSSGGGGGYHAVPPPASLLQSNQSPLSKPRTQRSGAADLSPTPASGSGFDGEKRNRRRPARRNKPGTENGLVGPSGDEVLCGESQCSPSTPYSPTPYYQQQQRSGGGSPFVPNNYPPRACSSNGAPYECTKSPSGYKNGRKNSYSEYEMEQALWSNNNNSNQGMSPARFSSPVLPVPQRFHSDVNYQLMRDVVAPQIFSDHWPLSKVNEALQAGRVFSCSLRVNAHNRSEAYATIEGVSVDILIDGYCAQNRAFEGDEVALFLDPPNSWPKLKGQKAANGGLVPHSNHTFTGDENGQASSSEAHVEQHQYQQQGERSSCVPENKNNIYNNIVVAAKDDLGSSSGVELAGVDKIQALLQATPGRRPTGKVVAILKKSPRRESIVGFLSTKAPAGSNNKRAEKSPSKPSPGPTPMRNSSYTLSPVDTRNPKMIVPLNNLPESISQRLQKGDPKVEKELLAGYVEHWNTDSPFPSAVITHSLGQSGELDAHTAAILFEHAVHSAEFPPQALACLPVTPWRIPDDELLRRKDLRSLRVFSIDPPTARDLDDALSVERLVNGVMRVGVHIADVSYFVLPGSELDKEAQKRSTSFYMVRQVLPMLPRGLCEELCSLNPGVDRLTFSVFWEFSPTGEVIGQWIGKSVIRSCVKLSYGDAQEMIEGSFKKPEGELGGGFSWDEVSEDVRALNSIAKKRRSERFENGALRLDTGKLVFSLDDDGIPYESSLYEGKDSNALVEEFMLLANMSVAKVISGVFPECALLRRHPEPNSRKLKEFEEFCRKNGFSLNTESAAALHSSLEALRAEMKDDPVMFSIVVLYATKPMQVAKYFCTRDEKDEDWGHYALAAPVYTHFTSPIRRYPDVVVHRTLVAALEAEKMMRESAGGKLVSASDYRALQLAAVAEKYKLPEAAELASVAKHCNERKLASKYAQEASSRLYLWTMLRNKQGLVSDACVVTLGQKFMGLYVAKIAMERRVYYDDVEGLKVDWLENSGTLILDYARPKHTRKPKARSIADVLSVSLDALAIDDDIEEGEEPDDSTARSPVEPLALPLTLRLFSHLPVLVHATGGDSSPLDIGVRLHVTSYLV